MLFETIAKLCLIQACSSLSPEAIVSIQESQAACQAYFVTCVQERRADLGEESALKVCVAVRPHQLFKDRVDRDTSKIKPRQRPQSVSGPAESNEVKSQRGE